MQGGKSTLLRATSTAVIFAHIGAPVPASACCLTPVDAIFTRLGASDSILQGKSTFMVESEETSSILQASTPNSIVILDELGRGTSTFDGYSIAAAVFEHLVQKGCRMLFATHYHPLTDEFSRVSGVQLGHMGVEYVLTLAAIHGIVMSSARNGWHAVLQLASAFHAFMHVMPHAF
jgi:DNA mismatch repair protein MSH6